MKKTLFNKNITIKEAKQLIEKGADVNEINSDGDTPLLIAIKRRSRGLIYLLVRSKAIPDLQGSKSALLTALKYGLHRNLIDLLIYNGANVNSIDPDYKYSVLDSAKYYNFYDTGIIRILRGKGAKERIGKALLTEEQEFIVTPIKTCNYLHNEVKI